MISRDALVNLFKELDEKTQLEIWNKFCYECGDLPPDENPLGVLYYCDNITERKDFWATAREVYVDNDEDQDDWESEVAQRVLNSPNYAPGHKYIRDSWDEKANVNRMITSDSVIDLIRKTDWGVPLYETDTFVAWFGKAVMEQLNKF